MIIRFITLFLLLARSLYWLVAEIQAHKVKPKLHSATYPEIIKRVITDLVGVLICLQLLGLSIWPFANSLLIQISGLLIVTIATVISIWARREIGANWSHAAEYQIKKNHQLVDQGIYHYIRHPIYSSFVLSAVGVELIIGSYLLFIFLIVFPIVTYIQAKNEEKILIKKFGDKYKTYIMNSKMFIPFVW